MVKGLKGWGDGVGKGQSWGRARVRVKVGESLWLEKDRKIKQW